MVDSSKPRVLISNDDGVTAPGLIALTAAIHQGDFCDFVVSGPLGERSAQSHCISISKCLHAFEISIEGAQEAFAVDGTPADSVMLALHGPLLQHNPKFDLVVSGINRGDNCGLHVIYSGTVGAAREAACKDLAALAFSLDNFKARSVEQYAAAAQYAVAIIKAALGILPTSVSRPLLPLRGHVLNINFPHHDYKDIKGLYLCSQSYHCSFPDFREVDIDPHFVSANGNQHHELKAGNVTLRAFRNSAGYLRPDERCGTDSWALHQGWVSVTPLGLLSDIVLTDEEMEKRKNRSLLSATASVVVAAGIALGVEASVPEGLL